MDNIEMEFDRSGLKSLHRNVDASFIVKLGHSGTLL